MNKAVLIFAIFACLLSLQAQTGRTVPTDSLVAHYPFSGNADDASGNDHHGTIYGATLTTDRFGNPEGAYHFVSSEYDYIRVPNHPQLQITNNLTISVWMKHAATAGCFEDIVMKGNSTYGFQFDSGSDEVLFHLRSSGGSWKNLSSLHTPVAGEWFNVVGTYDGATQRVYVNGIQTNQNSWSGTITNSADPLDFGYMVAGDNSWYNGELDDFRVYNRVLTADEVWDLYSENSSYLGVPPDVSVIYSGGNVNISWQAVSGADSYRVYSSELPDQEFILDNSGSFSGASWSAPATEPRRFYRVCAVD